MSQNWGATVRLRVGLKSHGSQVFAVCRDDHAISSLQCRNSGSLPPLQLRELWFQTVRVLGHSDIHRGMCSTKRDEQPLVSVQPLDFGRRH